ncbi:MAG: TA system VapC family ribonuclease toxin [Thermoleophilaceae bacterium]
MSFTLDVNLLLYASDQSSPLHEEASERLRTVAEGPELVYLFWPVLTSYLRIATHPSIFEAPLTPADAMDNVERLIDLPHVRSPGEDERFWDAYRAVVDGLVVRGNLVPDAHLVALMRQYDIPTIWSRDRDLRKFSGIRVHDPFA